MAGCYNQPFAFVFIADVVLLDVKRYFFIANLTIKNPSKCQ